jgi:uncharacterized protein
MPSTYSKVYMEDIGVGVKPIEGVSTSTAGFLGVAERGPIKPRLVTNFLDFERIFGNYQENSNLAYAVEGFFKNGGQRCFVGRITAKEDGNPAFLNWSDITNTKNFTMSAIGPGEWGNRVCVKIENGSLAEKKLELFKVTFVYFPEKYGDILNDTLSNIDDSSKFTFDPTNPFNSNNKTRNDLSLIVAESYDNLSPDPKSADYYKKKINGISNLVIISDEIHTNDSSPRPLNTDTKLFQWDAVSMGSVDSKALKDFLVWNFGQELLSWIASIEPLTPDAETIEFKNDTDSVRLERKENKVTVNINGKNSYEFNVKVENGKQIVYSSNIICFEKGSTKEDLSISDYRGFPRSRPDPNVPTDETQEILERTGLLGFEEVDEINFICVPDEENVAGLSGELIDHCEKLKDRFAILQSKMNDASAFEQLFPERESKYAALYFPWINVFDPLTNNQRLIPPGGHVAGVYTRSDIERGVHKAPANEVVRGATSLQVQLTEQEQAILNPRGVNVIRSFPGRGIIVYGARTMSTDSVWKYVNVRRLFLFLEESIEEGTRWTVFEPNNERLWSRVIATIASFLTRVWRDGALMGTTPEQAFFVKCDRTTITQDDIDNGRLIVLVGIAPVKPAEFVIFRIMQTKSGTEIDEF